MSDVELAARLSALELNETENGFETAAAIYADWTPAETEDAIRTPLANISTVMLPNCDADVDDIALCLTKRYVHILMNPDQFQNGTFLITGYRDLSVLVYTAETLPAELSVFVEPEVSDEHFTHWYIVPSMQYRFIGEIEGIGAGEDTWTDELGVKNGHFLILTLYENAETGAANYSLHCV